MGTAFFFPLSTALKELNPKGRPTADPGVRAGSKVGSQKTLMFWEDGQWHEDGRILEKPDRNVGRCSEVSDAQPIPGIGVINCGVVCLVWGYCFYTSLWSSVKKKILVPAHSLIEKYTGKIPC